MEREIAGKKFPWHFCHHIDIADVFVLKKIASDHFNHQYFSFTCTMALPQSNGQLQKRCNLHSKSKLKNTRFPLFIHFQGYNRRSFDTTKLYTERNNFPCHYFKAGISPLGHGAWKSRMTASTKHTALKLSSVLETFAIRYKVFASRIQLRIIMKL